MTLPTVFFFISLSAKIKEQLPQKICQPTVGWLSAYSQSTVGQQTTNQFKESYLST